MQMMTRSIHRMYLTVAITLALASTLATSAPTNAQSNTTEPPFSLPFATQPSPTTWMFEQYYGNTLDASNYGKYWYAAGQGLHFGMDLEAPCGTPVTAIGDGVVDKIDNQLFGAAPHNLVIKHEQYGYVSVYGHLRDKSTLMVGQPVSRGQVIAYTGDPDLNCHSRPHLHLEIRSLDYRIAYNPAPLIKADWDMLYSLHPADFSGFAKDLRRPNRWQFNEDQPETGFNGNAVNNFPLMWPASYRVQPPPITLPTTIAQPLNATMPLHLRKLTRAGCCTRPWWTPDSQAVRYLDMPLNADQEIADVFQVTLGGGSATRIDAAPPAIVAPNGKHEVRVIGNTMTLIELATDKRTGLFTRGAYPRFSPNSTKLLWHIRPADDIPGEIAPLTEIWVADVTTGEATLMRTQNGGAVRWLDEDRLLVSEIKDYSQDVSLSILTIATKDVQPLIETSFMRALTVSPGGKYLMYALYFQDSPDQDGVFLLETTPGATPKRLSFFGGWRWRDSNSVIYIPYNEPSMSLVLYDITTDREVPLQMPKFDAFSIAQADWEIAPDGQHIVYVEGRDHAIWVIDLPVRDWF